MYKTLADSTLQRMKKKEIIELLRIAEHNAKVSQEYVDQQAQNFKDWAPVVHGRWVHEETKGGFHIWRCSQCGRGMNDNPEGIDLYCYHCGAKME